MTCYLQILEVSDSNVLDRDLVTTKPKLKDIVKEHALYFDRDREVKNFEGDVLAYVTPVSYWSLYITSSLVSYISKYYTA